MFLLSIALWFVVVYSFRVAVFGNPLYRHVLEADRDFLAKLDKLTQNNRYELTQLEVAFLQRFSRLAILELAMLIFEAGLLVYLWMAGTMAWLCLGLLSKNLLLLAFSAAIARSRPKESLFDSLLGLPSWLMWVDRTSAMFSAIGAFFLFLVVNDINPF